MEGFGVHTFRLVNAEGKSTFVKFHWKPKLGLQSVVWNEAVKINGADPDFHRRDLWDAIDGGDFPEWELGVQLFDDDFADRFDFDVLDATKLIPEELVPVRRVGRLVLDRTVDNFFAETEQVAFCTQNVVPGIDFTNDPLLQGRNFSYLDTQLKRLGSPNFTHLPINAPKCPFAHFQQDGHMAMRNPVGRVNYEPNSWTAEAMGPREDPDGGFRSFPEPLAEATSSGVRSETLRRPLQPGPPVLRQPDADRAEAHRRRVRVRAEQGASSPGSGRGWWPTCATSTRTWPAAIADGLGLDPAPGALGAGAPPDHRPAAVARAEHRRQRPAALRRPQGRRAGHRRRRRRAPRARCARLPPPRGHCVELVAPKIGGVVTSDGELIAAHQKIDGGPSVLYDAVAILVSADGAAKLAADPAAKDFVTDAHAHCKFIAYHPDAAPLLDAAGVLGEVDEGYVALENRSAATTFVERCRKLRHWDRAKVLATA